ncbi:MAG: questin oxidase family protein [Pseudomonadales bacterium]
MSFDLASHGQRYLPEYPPDDNSDHLPMAWLALTALGASQARREAFASAYLPRLTTLAPDHPYARRVQALTAETAATGIPAVLDRYLPQWISGWHKEAYHPLIRIGYGVEFGVPGEVAAGLAYLESVGADQTLDALTRSIRHERNLDGEALLLRARALGPVPGSPNDRFSRRADAALSLPGMAALAVVTDDHLRTMSRAALMVFAGSHDFFALHLVTASHAFRLLYPYLQPRLGPRTDVVFTVGLLAGYLAAGAPAPAPWPGPDVAPPPTSPELLALCRDDEHDIKLAHAAGAHADHWRDPAFRHVARSYLGRRQDV